MNGKRRVLLQILTMSAVALGVGGIAISALYNVAFEQERARLVEIAQGRARLIEAVARFDAQHSVNDVPGGAVAATLSQVREAHGQFLGFGKTGEFELARHEEGQIVFLLAHRYDRLEHDHAVPFASERAEPMRRALSGASGTVVGLDHHGAVVLAAYEPVSELDLGIVAKIDLAEIRAPFLRAGALATAAGLVLVLLGTMLFRRIADPMVQRLTESEKRHRTLAARNEALLATVPEIIVEVDTRRVVQWVNQAGIDFYGAGVIGHDILDYLVEELESLENARPLLEGGRHVVYAENWQLRKDGEVRLLAWWCRILQDSGGCTLSTARDITDTWKAEGEQRKLETQLRQSQKMEAIGTLAGGIAHDFNNILQGALGYTELAILETAPRSNAAPCLEQVMNALRRAGQLVNQILAFSRQEEQGRETVQIQPIITETADLLRATLPATIDLRLQIHPACRAVLAEPVQIHQVLMNLCTNAYHAMKSKGGSLTISLEEVQVGLDGIVADIDLKPGVYACLTVADTGHGMDKGTRKYIFEPYFTTKETGEGTGLGLATVHGIVASYQGAVHVYSELEHGTTIRVFFPICEEQNDTAPASMAVAESVSGTERVLFVDDDRALVALAETTLGKLGYEVRAWTDSVEALEAFRANPSCFDVVISDQNMPRMTGSELAGEMSKIRPEIPFVLCSGFNDVLSENEAASLGVRQCLSKPIRTQELAGAIRRAVEAM